MIEDRMFWNDTIKMLKDTASELQVIVHNLDNIKTHTAITVISADRRFEAEDSLFDITKLAAKIQQNIDEQTAYD